MIRESSINSYNDILKSGLIKGLRKKVFDCLWEKGPMTQMELCKSIMNEGSFHQDRSYMPRFAELEKMGAIESTQFRKCKITGRQVLEWRVTYQIPNALKKKRTIKIWYCPTCKKTNSTQFEHADHFPLCNDQSILMKGIYDTR